MINCNPETVSTDYDTSDRLYFEPLSLESVLEIVRVEERRGTLVGVIVHNIGGLLIGYYVASFFALSNASIKTISIEVGMQNSGLAMALAVIHFSKVVALPAAIFSLWHNISASVLVYFSKKK